MGNGVAGMTKVLLAVAIGALSVLTLVTPAYAHNSLTGSNPEKGAKIAKAPESIILRFLAAVDPAALTVTVTGPDGADAGDGPPRVKGNRVTVGWRPGVAGEYAVAYRVGSSDGHPVKGTVRFTLTTAVTAPSPSATLSPPAAPGSSAAPGAAVPVPTAAGPTTGALGPAAGEDDGPGVWPWVAGAAVLAAAGAAGAVVVRRRRRAVS